MHTTTIVAVLLCLVRGATAYQYRYDAILAGIPTTPSPSLIETVAEGAKDVFIGTRGTKEGYAYFLFKFGDRHPTILAITVIVISLGMMTAWEVVRILKERGHTGDVRFRDLESNVHGLRQRAEDDRVSVATTVVDVTDLRKQVQDAGAAVAQLQEELADLRQEITGLREGSVKKSAAKKPATRARPTRAR